MPKLETVFYTADRPTYPWRTKINPLWWFDNDEDPDKGFVFRYIRNFMMNFKRFVVGVGDRNHWVTGKVPAMTVMRSDLGEKGWQYSVIWVGPFPILPFVSYSGTKVEWYLGFQPWGELALKFNLIGAKWQLW